VSPAPALTPDAAMVLGIASTAMPFARTRKDEAERWLRVLRLHGDVGMALQALGVSEGPLHGQDESTPGAPTTPASADDRDVVAQATEDAIRIASRRGATGVATTDVLMAVMRFYGPDFDRVLRAHGTDRDEVIEQLGASPG